VEFEAMGDCELEDVSADGETDVVVFWCCPECGMYCVTEEEYGESATARNRQIPATRIDTNAPYWVIDM